MFRRLYIICLIILIVGSVIGFPFFLNWLNSSNQNNNKNKIEINEIDSRYIVGYTKIGFSNKTNESIMIYYICLDGYQFYYNPNLFVFNQMFKLSENGESTVPIECHIRYY